MEAVQIARDLIAAKKYDDGLIMMLRAMSKNGAFVTTTNGWNFGSPGSGSASHGGISTASYNYYHQLDHNGSPLMNPSTGQRVSPNN